MTDNTIQQAASLDAEIARNRYVTPLMFVAVPIAWYFIGHYPVDWARTSVPNADIYQRAGTYGDSFGMANSLFSALAFAAIVATLIQQKLDLRLQRLEMRQAIQQHTASAEAQGQMERTQRFATYLSAIDTRHRIASDFSKQRRGSIGATNRTPQDILHQASILKGLTDTSVLLSLMEKEFSGVRDKESVKDNPRIHEKPMNALISLMNSILLVKHDLSYGEFGADLAASCQKVLASSVGHFSAFVAQDGSAENEELAYLEHHLSRWGEATRWRRSEQGVFSTFSEEKEVLVDFELSSDLVLISRTLDGYLEASFNQLMSAAFAAPQSVSASEQSPESDS